MIGYITKFGSNVIVGTLPPVNRRALEMVDINLNGSVVLRTSNLVDGVKINYDAGSTSPKRMGSVSQAVKIITGGMAIFETMKALEGTENYVEFTRVMTYPGDRYHSYNGVLTSVKDISPKKFSSRDTISIGYTFELFSPWVLQT